MRGAFSENGISRTLTADVPTRFIKKHWEKMVMTGASIDRRYCELCALSELKNALHPGYIWVKGSRQFKDSKTTLLAARMRSEPN
jgi:hypothetical protein